MTTSLRFREAMFGPRTDACPNFFVDIEHEDLAEAIRICDNGEDLVRNGETYLACGSGFQISLPDQVDGAINDVQIIVPNVDRRMVVGLRSLEGGPTVTLALALAETPDVTEAGPFEFELAEPHYDALVVTGSLDYLSWANDPALGTRVNTITFPGVF